MAERVTICRCCGGGGLIGYLDLSSQVRVNLCRRCAHSQLSVAVEPASRRHTSDASGTLARHARGLAEDALAWTGAERVLDLSCDGGTLMTAFHGLGCDVYGVVPRDLRPGHPIEGSRVLTGSWTPAEAGVLTVGGARRFDLITVTSALARVHDPLGFMRTCADAIAAHGTILIEVPYLAETIARGEVDSLHREYVSFFLARSFGVLAKRAGLEITHVIRTGGSIQFFLRPAELVPTHCPALLAVIDDERARGLHEPSMYLGFAARVEENAQRQGQINVITGGGVS